MRKLFVALLFVCMASSVSAETGQANFTGPLVTPNASGVPAGMVWLEPYLIYSESHAVYDHRGRWRTERPGMHQWMLVVPMGVGITPRLTAQLTPGMTYNVSGREHSDGARKTDTSLLLQYKLIAAHEDGSGPVLSMSAAHNFPTGKYNRLGDNPLNGAGSGASSNRFSLLGQQLYWLSNNHPLRLRAQMAWSPSPSRVRLHGTSSHGTTRGFLGTAAMGTSLAINTSIEYGLTEHWVLATDVSWNHRNGAHLRGIQCPIQGGACVDVDRHDGPDWTYSVAPAVEYNFNSNIGLIVGAQWSVGGHNASAYLAPQAALNMVF
ncbi:MAG TPA: hypothetical protein VIM98_20550 [Dyella sp.]|uniref:hypothetical protein n=1 Tax=Dyella sp. TaxID=1869338 RepID=UPI002F945DEA